MGLRAQLGLWLRVWIQGLEILRLRDDLDRGARAQAFDSRLRA